MSLYHLRALKGALWRDAAPVRKYDVHDECVAIRQSTGRTPTGYTPVVVPGAMLDACIVHACDPVLPVAHVTQIL